MAMSIYPVIKVFLIENLQSKFRFCRVLNWDLFFPCSLLSSRVNIVISDHTSLSLWACFIELVAASVTFCQHLRRVQLIFRTNQSSIEIYHGQQGREDRPHRWHCQSDFPLQWNRSSRSEDPVWKFPQRISQGLHGQESFQEIYQDSSAKNKRWEDGGASVPNVRHQHGRPHLHGGVPNFLPHLFWGIPRAEPAEGKTSLIKKHFTATKLFSPTTKTKSVNFDIWWTFF